MELEVSRLDLAEQPGLVLIVERRVPAEEDVDDHTHAPHVHGLQAKSRKKGSVSCSSSSSSNSISSGSSSSSSSSSNNGGSGDGI